MGMTPAVGLYVYCSPEWWPFPVFQQWVCHVTKDCFPSWPVYLCFPKLPNSKVLFMARCRIEVIFFFFLSFTWQFQRSGKYIYQNRVLVLQESEHKWKKLGLAFHESDYLDSLSLIFPYDICHHLRQHDCPLSLWSSRPAIDRFMKSCLFFLRL